jgi:hypothetical protein
MGEGQGEGAARGSNMKVQISKIRFNPENPRHFINPETINSLAACMKADGQLESVKTRKLTPQDTSSQGCTGTEPAEYEVFEGERRLRAAMKLGWLEIEAEVFTGSRDDFSLKGFMNNNGEPYLWLDKYTYIANYANEHKDLNQQQIGAVLDVDQATVSHAFKINALLNQASRELIYEQFIKKDYEVTVRAVIALAGLAKSKPDKDGRYSTEDVDNMERSLKVLIAGKMPEKQAKKLAIWVKKGGKPEEWKSGGMEGHPSTSSGQGEGHPSTGSGLYEEQWQELRETGYFQIKPAKAGFHIIIPDEHSAILAAFGAAGAMWALRAGEEGKGVGGKGEQQQNPTSFFEGNPYWADLPEMVEKIKENKSLVSSSKFLGKEHGQDFNSRLETTNQKLETLKTPETRDQKPETLNQQITPASDDPIDQLKAKALNAGVDLGKKGVNWLLKKLKKDL